MTIRSATLNHDRSITLIDEAGNILSMSSATAGMLKEQMLKQDVRDAIRYAMEDADGNDIALGSLEIEEDEFLEEVFYKFEEDIEHGILPSDDDIRDAVLDVASSYGILYADN